MLSSPNPVPSHDVSRFGMGEEIGEHGVRIRVTNIDPKQCRLSAVVVAINEFWSSSRFEEGEQLQFKPGKSKCWIIDEGDVPPNQHHPWFVLSVEDDATKRFEHYR